MILKRMVTSKRNAPFGLPEKSLCASFPSKMGTHMNSFRGNFVVKRGLLNGPFWSRKSGFLSRPYSGKIWPAPQWLLLCEASSRMHLEPWIAGSPASGRELSWLILSKLFMCFGAKILEVFFAGALFLGISKMHICSLRILIVKIHRNPPP